MQPPTSKFAYIKSRAREVRPLRVLWRTFMSAFQYRILGLAAETAFFALLSLPPLLFGLAGTVGYIARHFSVTSVSSFQTQIIFLAEQVTTPEIVDRIIAPTIRDVFTRGRVDVISIGFIIALWSGSRAMNTLMATSGIMYGEPLPANPVKARALSFGMYLLSLAVFTIVMPLVLIGPALIESWLPQTIKFLSVFYWPLVIAFAMFGLASLFHMSVPNKRKLRADLPGSALALIIWVLGSYGLRTFLLQAFNAASLYGPLASPIALLIWLYVTSLAVLLGAAFNASIDSVYADWSGLSPAKAKAVLKDVEE